MKKAIVLIVICSLNCFTCFDLLGNVVNGTERTVGAVADALPKVVVNLVPGVLNTIPALVGEVEAVVKDGLEEGQKLTEKANQTYIDQLDKLGNYTIYTLYTRAINETPVNITEENWPETKRYALLDKEFKFITHGWMSSGNTSTLQDIKNAYLRDRDINVVIVDWSHVADTLLYPIPAILTEHVGKKYGQLLSYLIANGIDINSLHLVGHSLGAHVSGYAAQQVNSGNSGNVSRITGLDPALPGFATDPGLSKDDAKFVDIIHTCAGALGMIGSVGHVDFYPNGGTAPQPGCTITDLLITCSHGRSHEYFAASINRSNVFRGHKCNTWLTYEFDHCEKDEALMGDPVSLEARGDYYLKTKGEYPYATDEQ